MNNYTPDDLKEVSNSKYIGCVIAAKYARKLHDATKDSTQYIEEKVTSESLSKLCSGDLNYEIIDSKVTKKKSKSIFIEKR
ncbi:MAG: DNA-directed RNA polymerase subunit omega [Gemmatimonadota bacterium]|nr:DNA-directed RNA polymerase subunit omega [Gemmatimonadota bacterium]